MHAPSKISIFALLMLIACFTPVSFAAEAGAGAIQQVSGEVNITDAGNVTRRAVAKENIRSGDTVTTEAKSEILIRMADGSTVALRPNTQFRFTDYRFEKTSADTSLVTLLRGAARMVTGLIGRNNPSNVRVSTITATIGIRGTDFDVAVVLEDTPDARAGVYNYVRDGTTNIQIASGQNLNVSRDQTAFAPDRPNPGEEPLQILRERPIFLQQGGGLDALIQSITIQVPVIVPVFR
jgi:FecR protein